MKYAAIVPLFTAAFILSGASAALAAAPATALSGSWRAAETAGEKSKRLVSIDKAIASMGAMRRSVARSRLTARTAPPKAIRIAVDGSQLSIWVGEKHLRLSLGAAPITLTTDDKKAQVTAKMQGKQLVVTVRDAAGGGHRITRYALAGKQLLVKVTMKSPKLDKAVAYQSTYLRK